MRRTFLLAGVLLCVVALGSDSPKEYDDRTERDELQGRWQLIEVSLNGLKQGVDFQELMTYRAGAYTYQCDNKTIRSGNYRIDTASNPHHLDEIPSNPSRWAHLSKRIYIIDGDTLRVAFRPDDGSRRPERFDDKILFVWTYKRVK